jgi:adenylylsulfate kinase-like enzyme
MIYWFTGQPSHGKTILATKLVNYLNDNTTIKTFHIDGDNLRALTWDIDFSEQGRIANVGSAQKIAHYLHNEGCNAVVSLVSPYRWQRENLKTGLQSNIVEFYIHTTEPRERDLFRVEDYEAPLDNFIDIDTTLDTPEESFKKILKNI